MSFFAFLAFLFIVSHLRSRRRLSHASYVSHNVLWESDYVCDRFYLKTADERALCSAAEHMHHSDFCRESRFQFMPHRNWDEYESLSLQCAAAQNLLMQYSLRWWWDVVDFDYCIQFLAYTMGEM